MILDGKDNIKRLSIFFFYDNDGILDDYIPYMLRDLNENINELLVVCNGNINEESKKKLEGITSHILIRENKGFDVWAYKAGIEYYGWKKIEEYDELILLNFTMFGPLFPLVEVFNEMNKRDVDFWGITKHHKVDFDAFGTCKYKYIPEHIQSSFLVIRNSLLKTQDYQKFWEEMPMINSYSDSVGYYEAIFTKDFKDKGYKEEVFVNTEDLREHTRYPLLMMSYELVKNRSCPFIKRKSFTQSYFDMLSEGVGESSLELYEYIRENTSYDLNLIWDNILRTSYMADVKDIMHFNYILPSKCLLKEEKKAIPKIALVVHMYFEDLVDYVLYYVKTMPAYADIYITTNSEEKKALIEDRIKDLRYNKIEVVLIQNRGRDVSALLVGAKSFIMNYDYVCFAHDKKTSQIKPYNVGEGFSYKCFENILGSGDYVKNVITTFEENPRLGLLTPPPPNHAAFFQTLISSWANNYNNTCELAEKLNLHVNIHWSKEPIAPLGTMFWFKPLAMKRLFDEDWDYNDFPPEPNGMDGTLLHAIERLYPSIVQYEGFYSAWVMTDKFARIEVTNLYYLLRLSLKASNVNTDYNALSNANNDLLVNIPLYQVIKLKLKKLLPPSIWKLLKKVLYTLVGKK